MGIALILRIDLGKMAIFPFIILLIHEHRESFHLLRSYLYYFFRDLKFFVKSYTCLIRATIVKCVIFLISFSTYLSFE